MRIVLAAAAAVVALTACSSSRAVIGSGEGTGAGIVEPPSVAAAPVEPQAPAGPIEASALAREAGLAIDDQGTSVLLSNADLRARFFPGSDSVSLDGRQVAMRETAERQGPSLFVPADGVRAVRRAVADARARRLAALIPAPAPRPAVPVLVSVAPPMVHVPTPRPVLAIEPGPGWVVSVPERPWNWVVVHHSDDICGCFSKYDAVHRGKGWDNGCGYDFVIGNGTMTGDGQVEVGPRWSQQLVGAHAKTPDNRFNERGIGIVMVGDFEHGCGPTRAQYESLVRLTRWLMNRYAITPDRVIKHGDAKATACPGKNFPWSRFIADASAVPTTATPP